MSVLSVFGYQKSGGRRSQVFNSMIYRRPFSHLVPTSKMQRARRSAAFDKSVPKNENPCQLGRVADFGRWAVVSRYNKEF